jgi:hypothetical protein
MNFHTFDKSIQTQFNEREFTDIQNESYILEGFGVDLTTLSKILEGDF